MSKIQVLDPVTIDKIAAGEVVERPASIVKELAENAIDAGATAITVEIEEGGISYIRIADNGCGIEREEVPSAFLRHSTSKIRTVDDLIHIRGLPGRADHKNSRRDLWNTIPDRRRERRRAGGNRRKRRNNLCDPTVIL